MDRLRNYLDLNSPRAIFIHPVLFRFPLIFLSFVITELKKSALSLKNRFIS